MSAITAETLPPNLADTSRLLTARRIFKGAFAVNVALTAFLIAAVATSTAGSLVGAISFSAKTIGQVVFGVLFFNVLWGAVWFGLKNWLLKVLA
jgi:hypothetical protein